MKRILRIFFLVFVVVILVGIVFPPGQDINVARKVQAKNDELQLANAIKSFYTEYGRLPKTWAESVPADRKLMSILLGLDHQENPRKIVFIEVQDAKKKQGVWKNGIHPETGSWVDPWGNPYLVKLDTDYDGIIYNPYDSGAGDKKLHAQVIVWSPGQDGIFGNAAKPGDYQGSKDIISWQ